MDNCIEVGGTDEILFLRIRGKGTFLECQRVRKYIERVLDRGPHRVVVDTGDCGYMDSSFLGTLTGIAIRLRKQNGTRLEITNMCPKVRDTIFTIGLNHIFKVIDISETSGIPTRKLTGEVMDELELARDMLKAHENLGEISEENVDRFRCVTEVLKKEINLKKTD